MNQILLKWEYNFVYVILYHLVYKMFIKFFSSKLSREKEKRRKGEK